MHGWGTPVEKERRRRIFVAAYAYAYEIDNDPLVDDAVFDRECALVDVSISTDNPIHDKFFAKHFNPHSGMWVHKHPNKPGLKALVQRLRKSMLIDTKKLAAQVLADIDAHTAKKYDDGHRKHLGASLIGDGCARKLWYNFRWVKTPTYVNVKGENHKGRMLRLFNRGHKEEFRFVEWLREMGFIVEEYDASQGLDKQGKPQQFRIKDVDGHFGGSCDGFVQFPAKYGALPRMLTEFKTSSDKYFDKLKEAGVKKEKYQHFCQMSTYGKYYGVEYALYLCVNKNTDEIYAEVVKLDLKCADEMLDKARTIINAAIPPKKISENSAYFTCKMCDFASVCHGQAAYEKNCRSCAFAQPAANGQWQCGHYGIIPPDFIAQGCASWQEVR
jgi:hypothetical protein